MAARRLGAASAWACDFDPDAVRVARENIERNHVDGVTAEVVDVLKWRPGKRHDCVAANIFFDILVDIFPKLVRSVRNDGVVLVSTYGPTPAILGLDPADGRPVLRFGLQGTGAREHGIHGAPLEAEGGTLVFGGPDDLVHALAPDGSFLWAVDVGDDVDGTIALIDDRVLVVGTSAGRVVRIDDAP